MKPEAPASDPPLNHALPGWAVDAILFGIPEQDRRKVWAVCMRIAMTAYRRGWSEAAYYTEITGGKRDGLWQQLISLPGDRRRTKAGGYRDLQKAWRIGVANASGTCTGTRTQSEIAAEAADLAARWADRITDSSDSLNEVEAAVLGYVVAETGRRGYLKVTCPGRQVAEFAKIPHRTAVRVLARLVERGLLIKHSSGRGGEAKYRKAAIYGLVDPDTTGT